MPKLIYLEPEEEITDVIGKISEADSKSVSLVIPRGSTLANSVVNLKLLVKRSKALKKDVALVTNDNIAHNLAAQIGLPVFESIEDAKAGIEPEVENKPAKMPEGPGGETKNIDGVKVHQYDREAGENPDKIAPVPEVSAPTENEGEVIEAVRDVDEEPPGGEIAFVGAASGADNELAEDAGKSDYKLMKKPMQSHEKQRDFPGSDSGSQVFGNMRTAGSRKKRIITYISIAVAILLIFGAYIALPKAKVTLSVVSEPFSSAADINVSKDATSVDTVTSTIPGKIVTDEEELEKPFAPSGTKNIGAKAKGKITVYNYWDNNPKSIPAGTQFSSAGIVFVSTSAATVPGGTLNFIPPTTAYVDPPGTVDVNVEAQNVGEQGNIGPSDFVISSFPASQQLHTCSGKACGYSGKSAAKMTGGTNQIVKVVSDKDVADAKTSTENELKDTIMNKIKSGLAGNEKLLDSAIAQSITSESASAKSGDQVDTFNYKAKIKIDALVFSEDDFKAVLLESARGKLASDKDIVANGSQNIKYDVASSDVAKGTITLKGTFDGFISGKYDVEAMKKAIKFKSINSATAKLTGYPGVLSANISTTPSFLRSLPAMARKITIEFNYGSTPLTTGGSGGR